MYSLLSFRRYSVLVPLVFLNSRNINKKGSCLSFRGSQKYLRKRKNITIIEATNAIMHDQNLSMILWTKSCMA
jgi:hypothetical protein